MHTFFVFPLFCECAGIIINHISAANISRSLVYPSKDWQHLTIVIWNPCYQGWLHCLLKQFLIFQGSWICSLPPLPQTKDCRNHISRTFKCNPLFPYHLTTPMKVSPPFTPHRCTVFAASSNTYRDHILPPASDTSYSGKKMHPTIRCLFTPSFSFQVYLCINYVQIRNKISFP